MTLRRLGKGRPGLHRLQTTGAHEQNDAPQAANRNGRQRGFQKMTPMAATRMIGNVLLQRLFRIPE
jgi:hypothetical protein